MPRGLSTGGWAAGMLVVLELLACTPRGARSARHHQQVPAPPAVDPPAPPPATETTHSTSSAVPEPSASDQEPPAAPELGASPADAARALADRWCEHGGEQFAPPGSDPDGYPYPLPSCDQITTRVEHRRRVDQTDAALLSIDADGHERRELLYYRGAHGPRVFALHHELEDESGEGGSRTRTVAGVDLRDVMGDGAPEWLGTFTTVAGDSFEADRCFSHTTTQTELVICEDRPDGLRCLAVTTVLLARTEPRAAEELYDCDALPKTAAAHLTGYRTVGKVEHGAVVFSRSRGPTVDEPEPAPVEGRIALDDLFEAHALEP